MPIVAFPPLCLLVFVALLGPTRPTRHVVRPLATDARVGSRGPRGLDPTWLWKYIDIGIVLLLVVIVAVVAQLFSLLFVSLVLFK